MSSPTPCTIHIESWTRDKGASLCNRSSRYIHGVDSPDTVICGESLWRSIGGITLEVIPMSGTPLPEGSDAVSAIWHAAWEWSERKRANPPKGRSLTGAPFHSAPVHRWGFQDPYGEGIRGSSARRVVEAVRQGRVAAPGGLVSDLGRIIQTRFEHSENPLGFAL